MLGQSRQEVEEYLQNIKQSQNIKSSQAQLLLEDLLDNYEFVIRKQNKTLCNAENFQSKIQVNKSDDYLLVIESIKQSMVCIVQNNKTKIVELVMKILHKHNVLKQSCQNVEMQTEQIMEEHDDDEKMKIKAQQMKEYFVQNQQMYIQELQQQLDEQYQQQMELLEITINDQQQKIISMGQQMDQQSNDLLKYQNQSQQIDNNMKILMFEQGRTANKVDEDRLLIKSLSELNQALEEKVRQLERDNFDYQIIIDQDKTQKEVTDQQEIQYLKKQVTDYKKSEQENQDRHTKKIYFLQKQIEKMSDQIDEHEFKQKQMRDVIIQKNNQISELDKQLTFYVKQYEQLQKINEKLDSQLMQSNQNIQDKQNKTISEIVNKMKKSTIEKSKNVQDIKVKQEKETSQRRKSVTSKLSTTQQNRRSSKVIGLMSYDIKKNQPVNQFKTSMRSIPRIGEGQQFDDEVAINQNKDSDILENQVDSKKQYSGLKRQSSSKGFDFDSVKIPRRQSKSVNELRQIRRGSMNYQIDQMTQQQNTQKKEQQITESKQSTLSKVNLQSVWKGVSQNTDQLKSTSNNSGEGFYQKSKQRIDSFSEFKQKQEVSDIDYWKNRKKSIGRIYPFKDISQYSPSSLQYQTPVNQMEIDEQNSIKMDILMKFIQNHQKCGPTCSHQDDFYEQYGIFDNYQQQQIRNSLKGCMDSHN